MTSRYEMACKAKREVELLVMYREAMRRLVHKYPRLCNGGTKPMSANLAHRYPFLVRMGYLLGNQYGRSTRLWVWVADPGWQARIDQEIEVAAAAYKEAEGVPLDSVQ